MATMVATERATDQRIVLEGIDWDTYEQILAAFGDRRVPRVSYNQGALELMSPSAEHEEDGLTLAQVVEVVATELDIDYRAVGSMTVRRRDLEKGFEADASFYLRRSEMIRGRPKIVAISDPPPDLVIEIDVTHLSLDKLPIYAAIGVPEIWRCHGDRVTILHLVASAYRESPISLALPPLTADTLSRFLVESRTRRRPDWIRSVRGWVQEQRQVGDA